MNATYTTLTGQRCLAVESIRDLTKSTYVVRLEKGDLNFTPGQCLLLGIRGSGEHREYSIYSPNTAPYLEVLVTEVEDGNLSKKLRQCKPGTQIEVEGPVGFFTLPDSDIAGSPAVFIATGTGISPFHCMVQSYPTLDYQILHGLQTTAQTYDRDAYDAARYTLCTSRDDSGDASGHVTDFLAQTELDLEAHYYLCGNSEMIDDAYDILATRGVDANSIRAEVYF